MKIEGKNVLVTGSNRGIGRALVEAALERGAARVYATARTPSTLAANAAGLALIALAACEGPADGMARAVTTEAIPVVAEAKPGASETVKYTFDQTTSRIEWTGSQVTGKHEGGFRTFAGAISLVDRALEKSSVTIDIDTASLFADVDKLQSHLRSADFFDVAKFPKASFALTALTRGGEKGASHTVRGNLTLHGVTKSIGFPVTIKTDPGSVDVDAEFAINRKDFGLVYPGKPDDLIGDDVVIRLTIRSRKPS